MKTLYLVRHAKSSWKLEGIDDKDRPLTGRGIRDAHGMADWLTSCLAGVPAVYTSPAIRALHTATILARALGMPSDRIGIADALYDAGPSALTDFLRQIAGDPSEVVLVGHNPGLFDLIDPLVPGALAHLPTAGVVILDLDMPSWRVFPEAVGLRSVFSPTKST